MFKGYKMNYIINNKYYILIIDDDFEKKVVVITQIYCFYARLCDAIIKVYSEKQLDVAKNLFLYMKYIEYSGHEIENQINDFSLNVSDFNIYLPEIKKYLLFL